MGGCHFPPCSSHTADVSPRSPSWSAHRHGNYQECPHNNALLFRRRETQEASSADPPSMPQPGDPKLSQGPHKPSTPLRQELRDRQSPRFTQEVGVVAGIHKSPPGPLRGRLQRSMRKTEEILPLQGLRSPDHQCIWGGCRDLSVRFDEEHQVPSLGTRGGQNPSPQGRVCLHNIRRWKRPLPLFTNP